jgi:hypothetical protein
VLYKFKSEAAADVIMLEATGRQVLQIMGRGPDTKGILLPADIPAAKAALEQAIAQEEARPSTEQAGSEDAQAGESAPASRVSLRARAWPLVTMMERCLKADKPITWGV